MAAAPSASVFINCPFDEHYQPLFEAIVFCVAACGFVPRCTLELTDAGEVRIENIYRLIAQCNHSIHDISRTEVEDQPYRLPRFNMPLELGIFLGAKRFGGRSSRKRCLIMDRAPYRYKRFISDIGGQRYQGAPLEIRERNSTCARLAPIRTGKSRHSRRDEDLAGLSAILQRAANHRTRGSAESGTAYFH
jgi:hypothetical protein